MKLKKITIFGFGPLKEKEFNLEPGINLFFGRNNSGKSSIMNFILWMLYGPPERDDQGQFSYLLQSFDPRRVGGEIIYELDDGIPFCLRRHFNGVSNNLTLKNLTTDIDITPELCSDHRLFLPPGECHLGVSRHLFEYICLFRRSPWEQVEQNMLLPEISSMLNDGGKGDFLRQLLSRLDLRLAEYDEESIERLRADTERQREGLSEQMRRVRENRRLDPATLERMQTITKEMQELSGRIHQIDLIQEAVERDQLFEKLNKIKEVRSRLDQLESRLADLAGIKKLTLDEEDRLTELLCRREELENREDALEEELKKLEGCSEPRAEEPPHGHQVVPGVVSTLSNLRNTLADKKSELVKKIHDLCVYSLNLTCREIEKEKKQTKRWFALICLCFAAFLIYGILKENALFSILTIILPILLIPVFIKMKNVDTVLKKLQRRRLDLENDVNRWKEKSKIEIAEVPVTKAQQLLISHRVYLQNFKSVELNFLKKFEIEINKLRKTVSDTEAKIREILVKTRFIEKNDPITFKRIDSFIDSWESLYPSGPARESDLESKMTRIREKQDEVKRELCQVSAIIGNLLQESNLQEGNHLKEEMDLAGEKARIEDEIRELHTNYPELLEKEPEGMIRRLDLLTLRTASVQIPEDKSELAHLDEARDELKSGLENKRAEYIDIIQRVKAEDDDMPDPASLELEMKASEQKLHDILREKEVLNRIRALLDGLVKKAGDNSLAGLNQRLSQTILRALPHEEATWIVDEQFRIHYQAGTEGTPIPAEYLGSAHKDFAKLVMGLAIHALMSSGREKLPLLLDECSAFCDDRLTYHFLDLLAETAADRQVLFFTCKGRERDYLRDQGNLAGKINFIQI